MTFEKGVRQGVGPFSHGSAVHTDIMKTQALKQALDKHKFDVAFGGAHHFEAATGFERTGLFRTDGTAAGTALVKDIGGDSEFWGPSSFGVMGDTLYFRADDGVHGYELWKSGGNAGVDGSFGISIDKPLKKGGKMNHKLGEKIKKKIAADKKKEKKVITNNK